MSNNGILQRGIKNIHHIPGQLEESSTDLGRLPMDIMMSKAMPPKPRKIEESVVDLELLPDQSNPQFMALYGKLNETRLPVGRIHNTNLASRDGLRYMFNEVRGTIHKKLGLSEEKQVTFGDLTWRVNLLPKHVVKMIGEALDYTGIQLTGTFGPDKQINPRSEGADYRWFHRPPAHVHDEGQMDQQSLTEASTQTKMFHAYATGKVQGYSTGKTVGTIKGLGLALATLLGIAGFKKILGEMTMNKIVLRSTSIIQSRLKSKGQAATTLEILDAIKKLAELPRIQWKINYMANVVKEAKPEEQGKAMDNAAEAVADLVIKELGL